MAPAPEPAEFFAGVARLGPIPSRRPGAVLFEVAGPSGGRWLLRLGGAVEQAPPGVACDLSIRLTEDRFDRFVRGELDVVEEVESGRLVLAGDLDLLDDLARAFRAPLSVLELRSGGGG